MFLAPPPRRFAARASTTLALALAIHGCGSHDADAGQNHETAQPAAVAAPEPAPEPPSVEHELQPGETLWDLARTYHVGVDEILEANHLRRRDVRRLSQGRHLSIPGAEELIEVTPQQPTQIEDLPPVEDGAWHLVAEGETLWDIARSYDLSVDAILTRNELDDEAAQRIHPGQALIIPGLSQSQIHQAEPSDHAPRGFHHLVARGETIWDLARSFHVSVAELMAANRLSPENAEALREGERLYIPGARQGDDRGSHSAPRLNASQRRAQALARRLGLGTSRAGHEILGGRLEPRWIRAAGGSRGRFPGTLRWPVTHGRFVRGYGSGDGGYHLAVDIAGSIGWNVRAAAPGIVGYAGDGIRGYGNVVLLIHPGGWITMYAHNSMIYVVAGERVPAGAVLAELGSTGISRGPHVHFEFMYNGQNCDPAALFRPGVRHAHRLAHITPETWARPNHRPADLRCHHRMNFPHSGQVDREVVPDDGSDDDSSEP